MFRKAELAATVGVIGAAQIARSALGCPYRNATAETWRASQACVEATLGLLAAGAVDPAQFDAREHQILDPYVNGPPGGAAPVSPAG
ncbi:MAG TPA: hypothetical protein VF466_02045 [Candidatus Saccharimonadales bacterium]